ncbi:MAG: PEP-CTERM sorting domain-containing protein [Phycisphaerae bacterium]
MRSWICGSLVLVASAGVARANLVTNGDFATGDLTGWSVFHGDAGTTPTGSGDTAIGADAAHGNPAASGLLDRSTGTVSDNKDFLYQLVPVTPGTQYAVDAQWSGNLIGTGGTASNARNWSEVYVAFFPTGTVISDATQLPDSSIRYKKRWDISGTSGNTNTFNVDQATGSWGWESVLQSPDTVDTATVAGPTDGIFTATDSLMLVGFNLGGRANAGTASFNVDNVTVTEAAATPEPGTLAIGGLVAGLMMLRRRRLA